MGQSAATSFSNVGRACGPRGRALPAARHQLEECKQPDSKQAACIVPVKSSATGDDGSIQLLPSKSTCGNPVRFGNARCAAFNGQPAGAQAARTVDLPRRFRPHFALSAFIGIVHQFDLAPHFLVGRPRPARERDLRPRLGLPAPHEGGQLVGAAEQLQCNQGEALIDDRLTCDWHAVARQHGQCAASSVGPSRRI